MKYKDYSPDDLYTELYTVRQEFDEIKGQGLNLNMARGVPSKDQLELTMPMLDILKGDTECFAEDGTDCLDVSFDIAIGSYGDSRVEAFDPAAYGISLPR